MAAPSGSLAPGAMVRDPGVSERARSSKDSRPGGRGGNALVGASLHDFRAQGWRLAVLNFVMPMGTKQGGKFDQQPNKCTPQTNNRPVVQAIGFLPETSRVRHPHAVKTVKTMSP